MTKMTEPTAADQAKAPIGIAPADIPDFLDRRPALGPAGDRLDDLQ